MLDMNPTPPSPKPPPPPKTPTSAPTPTATPQAKAPAPAQTTKPPADLPTPTASPRPDSFVPWRPPMVNLNPFQTPIVLSPARTGIEGLVHGFVDQVKAGLNVQSSPLSAAQQQLLAKVYPGASFSGVQLVQMPPQMEAALTQMERALNPNDPNARARTFTVGNMIILPSAEYAQLTSGQNPSLLIHESAHVLQYAQGVDVMGDSLKNQIKDGPAAYDWQSAVQNGTSWPSLNVEQQASLIQAAYDSGFFDDPGAKMIVGGVDVTDLVKQGVLDLTGRK